MNRRSFFTGLATLAVWPMAIRPRMRRDLRVFTPIPDAEPFRYTVPEPHRDYVLSWYTKVKGDRASWVRVFHYITEHQARGILEVGAYPLPVPDDAYCIQLDQAPTCSNYENEERAGLNLLTDSDRIAHL